MLCLDHEILYFESSLVLHLLDVLSGISRVFITTRKRSLRRLCFHRYLSVHRGVSVSVRGFWSMGVSVRGGLSPGVLCPGGLWYTLY